jgi:hypothetical protein
LRLAVDSIPPSLIKDDHFYLSPPDFDMQNVFIDDNGNITGIIDWDSARTMPLIRACVRYPLWITRDWNPTMYRWQEEEEEKKGSSNNAAHTCSCFEENSPTELSRYRRVYADAFAALDLPAELYASELTRLSHILESIEFAAQNMCFRMSIVPRLLEHAFDGRVPFDYTEYCKAYLEGKADAWLEQAKEAFGRMWHAEWESGEGGQREA